MKLTWLQRYRLRSFLRSTMWLGPLTGIVAAFVVGRLSRWIGHKTGWTMLGVGPEGARAVVGALSSSMLTFIVFVFSVLLVSVQLASAQLTPRIIARMFNDRATKIALGVFVFTYIYSLIVLARIEDTVPQLSVFLSGYSGLICIATFLYLIDRVGESMRPVTILTKVATEGRQVIQNVYPFVLSEAEAPRIVEKHSESDPPSVFVEHIGAAGVLLAFDVSGLVELAQKSHSCIELVPQVGDFVAPGDPLFRIFHSNQQVNGRHLRESVALGRERTMQQDPAFAFRIIVDIASKALSPAINDPTTAVLALDQIQNLLQQVGKRQLNTGRVLDSSGQLRLLYRTPNWDDFVCLAVTEIRQFGKDSVQVARRLRAMLEDLIASLPPQREVELREELILLQRSVERNFEDLEDRKRAHTGDLQGIGGSE